MPLKQNPIETDEKGRFKPRSGLIDLTGMKFNRLTAVSYVGQSYKKNGRTGSIHFE